MREQFNVAGVPTVILAKPDGEEIDRTLGFIKTETFIDTVSGYQKGVGTLAAMLAKESDKKAELNYILALGDKLFAHARYDDADVRFAAIVRGDTANAAGLAAEAQLNRAKIAGKVENYMLATAFCKALREKWPECELIDDATIYLAHYSQKGGQDDDALAAYKEYLERWPDGEDAGYASKQIEKIESPEDSSN